MAILPVYNIITVPDSNIYFRTEYYRLMTDKVPTVGEKVTLIVLKEDLSRNQFQDDSFYPIGLNGFITEVHPEGYAVAHMDYRVNVSEINVFPDQTIGLFAEKRSDVDDLDQEYEEKRLHRVKEDIRKFAGNFQWGSMAHAYISKWKSLSEIISSMSPWIINDNNERYALLKEDSMKNRNDLIEKMIYENVEMADVKNRAKSAQEQDYQKIYKESAIKKQMEYLQKELDEMHPEDVSDLRRLELQLENTEMNEDAKKEGRKILNRLKKEGQHGAETGMLQDYLEFLVSLPWKKEDAGFIHLDEAKRILDEDHSGLKKVKKRIIQQIAVMNLRKQQSGSILLFVGAPGTGKTSIGRSIARALNRKYVRVSLGGVRDEADIRGHRRTYIGSMPGRIMDGISKSGVSNPVMVLDEVDKLSQSYNGDPASALLEVLDPEQNANFTDHYLNVPYDLSDVLFICTANTLDTIPEPLLNRMEVIQFPIYTPIEKLDIAREHLIPKAMEASGLQEGQLEIDDEALKTVISDYTMEAGVRGLKKRMDMICRSAVVERLEQEIPETVHVTKDQLEEYLDMSPLRRKNVRDEAKPGVVTGLAWTSVGGDILYIETLLTKGSGKLQITGRLGDVMKESAQLAVSLVKSLFPDQADQFKDQDLHIHVPDGATPKDGPSAGITLTTALASLVSGVPVSPRIAMTGEISLEGDINPIGGLPEKLMAARLSGVKKVFIPRDNVKDLRDVAEEVKEALEIVPADTVFDVLSDVGIIEEKAELRAV